MNVLITGGLGFIGTQLAIRLLERGNTVTIVDHAPQPKAFTPKEANYISADTTVGGKWQDELGRQDAVINLAGASIFSRWSKKRKKLIYDSRILTTRHVVEAIPKDKETILCSTSAVGYYGFRGDEELAEGESPGDDFLARVCVDWEAEAARAADKGVRVAATRFGIVLGKTGGALGQMMPLFKGYIGGPLGSGEQWFSWVHMDDLLSAFLFILDTDDIAGPVNICAPNPVRNRQLAKALGNALSRPSFFRVPGFPVRLILGEFGTMLTRGQRVVPAKLLDKGFVFRYPDIDEALAQVVAGNN